jgi:hypothetical protein
MLYQLPNGKVIFLSIEEFLSLSDEDIQYFISVDYGEHISRPFDDQCNSKYYDFDDYMPDEDDEKNPGDDNPFDNIIDINDNLDM